MQGELSITRRTRDNDANGLAGGWLAGNGGNLLQGGGDLGEVAGPADDVEGLALPLGRALEHDGSRAADVVGRTELYGRRGEELELALLERVVVCAVVEVLEEGHWAEDGIFEP